MMSGFVKRLGVVSKLLFSYRGVITQQSRSPGPSTRCLTQKFFNSVAQPREQSSVETTEKETPLGIGTGGVSILDERKPYQISDKFNRIPYWQKIPRWKDVSEEQFLDHEWNKTASVLGKEQLKRFLSETLPPKLTPTPSHPHITTPSQFIEEVLDGIKHAPMSILITPHILSLIDWNNPFEDPLRKQFIPIACMEKEDHPMLKIDSLGEEMDSATMGLVHRYPSKVLFLVAAVCPLYCRFCTRSRLVGGSVNLFEKSRGKLAFKAWENSLQYIARNPAISDVVVSGGDTYSLRSDHLAFVGNSLLNIPHVQTIRFATKGLCVAPQRIMKGDDWTKSLVGLSDRARNMGKHVCLHTHFNHPNEITWVNREAAQSLYAQGVMVRNQTVLLKGVNDDTETMGRLIRELANSNIDPYYVYQGDMVKGVEDLRTPLSTILKLEEELRGGIAGFRTPQFVVDLPGGGGKRLAATYKSYDRITGISKFVAPGIKGKGKEGKTYEYYDPLHSLPDPGLFDERGGRSYIKVNWARFKKSWLDQ